MACNKISRLTGDGKVAHGFVCMRGSGTKPCVTCGKRHEILCDYPVTRDGVAGTCDRACCRQHSVSVGQNLDYCLAHARLAGKEKP